MSELQNLLTEMYGNMHPNFDCSESAADFLQLDESGTIFSIVPLQENVSFLINDGTRNDYFYHTFYMKDGFVYDPHTSNSPIEYEKFTQAIIDLNPSVELRVIVGYY